jgi:simple sugar transport system substrate-binding protein
VVRRPILVAALACLALTVLLGACGGREVVREDDVVVRGAEGSPATSGTRGAAGDGVRIWVVTHGQASSPFWAIIRNGVEAAARQMDVLVTYRAPDIYSLDRMKGLVDQAVAAKPDGLVVSIPEPGLAPAIRRATASGLPVVSINTGSDVFRSLGVLAHVGQPERRSGLEAGRRLARSGVRRALCVNQQVGNTGLDDRCRGLSAAMKEVGGKSRVLAVDDQSTGTPAAISTAIAREGADGVLTLNSTTALQAEAGIARLGRTGSVALGTFDLGPDVLADVEAGKIGFAVDQQAYLQGYLPIVLLAQRARYGLFPARGDVIATGPNFVTRSDAARVIALSGRSIR